MIRFNIPIKESAMHLTVGLLFVIIFSELYSLLVFSSPYDEWTILELKERTAVEMHAEDIWKNNRSTLRTFNPSSCINEFHNGWWQTWHEVACFADDDKGKTWRYTARYSLRSSYLIGWLPFLRDTRASREITQLESNQAIREQKK
jgi:hypothetical protein